MDGGFYSVVASTDTRIMVLRDILQEERTQKTRLQEQVRERKTDRQTDRGKERHRDTHRDTQRVRQRVRQRESETHETDTKKVRQTQRSERLTKRR